MYSLISEILNASLDNKGHAISIGESRDNKSIAGYRFGYGEYQLSLIAGCHADEPTGPKLLNYLVGYLSKLPLNHPLINDYTWWIVPHVNPDGEAINQSWYDEDEECYDLARYLRYVRRELPGDDVEFGFPIEGKRAALRPENQVIYDFWRSTGKSFDLHISLHGMSMAQGPWFLIDPSWINRCELIMERCKQKVLDMKYRLHDVDREGEKGFHRIGKGFCTRPDSEEMRKYFLSKGQPAEADKFHPSSMESIRSLGGDCLTLVSEMPLFILPPNDDISWPNKNWESWKDRFQNWKYKILSDQIGEEEFEKQVKESGLKAMAIKDQMILQWHFFWSGVEQMQQSKAE